MWPASGHQLEANMINQMEQFKNKKRTPAIIMMNERERDGFFIQK